MIDFHQLRDLVVLPVCCAFPRPEEAATLLLRIAAHESLGGRYLRQIGKDGGYGPGRGLWQMEPATRELVDEWVEENDLPGDSLERWRDYRCWRTDYLQWDMRLSAFYGRLLLFASRWAMPDEDDHEKAYIVYLDVWKPGKPPTYETFLRRYEQWKEGRTIT